MENTTHTPAPWHIGKHGTPDYAPQYGIYYNEDSGDLAIIKGSNAKANAHLIAAAPELLEACEDALNYLIPRASGSDINKRESNLKAVIAKAKGE